MAEGRLLHLCKSMKKGIAKHEVPSASITVEHGMEGDAHAGGWHRQVSLLAHSDIEAMRAKGLELRPGAFGENLVIDGLPIDELGVGSRLKVGPVLLELTQIGKICHTRCAIYYATGDCIMPRTGLFARVLEGGELAPGTPVEVVQKVPRSAIQAAVVTIKDCSAADTTFDASGSAVSDLLRDELHAHIAWTTTVPDEIEQISEALIDLCDRRVDLVVITTGGTGISTKGATPEAIRNVIDRELPEPTEALLSPAIAGVRRETLIVSVPGKPSAAFESLSAILPRLQRAVQILRGETVHTENGNGRLITLKSKTDSEFESALAIEFR